VRQGKYGSGRVVSGVAAHPIFSGAICFKRFCDDQVGAHLRSGAGASVVLLLRAALRPESGAMIPGGGLGAWRGRADSVLTGRTITRLRFSPTPLHRARSARELLLRRTLVPSRRRRGRCVGWFVDGDVV
jgi:hypothetical protein